MGGYQTYARTDIQTSDPRAVVVLLYEGSIKFLNRAVASAKADKRMEMSEYILKTQKIIHYLLNALDFDDGGDVAENLYNLYSYMRDRLNQANLTCDVEKIEEVIELFKPLLEAWREIAKDPIAQEALEKRAAKMASQPKESRTSRSDSGAPVAQPEEPAPQAKQPQDADADADAAPSQQQSAAGHPKNVAAGRAAYGVR